MRIANLNHVFDFNQLMLFEGRLYERLERVAGGPKHKYRVILSDDDYDYVSEPALRKRLDRAFKRTDKKIRSSDESLS